MAEYVIESNTKGMVDSINYNDLNQTGTGKFYDVDYLSTAEISIGAEKASLMLLKIK